MCLSNFSRLFAWSPLVLSSLGLFQWPKMFCFISGAIDKRFSAQCETRRAYFTRWSCSVDAHFSISRLQKVSETCFLFSSMYGDCLWAIITYFSKCKFALHCWTLLFKFVVISGRNTLNFFLLDHFTTLESKHWINSPSAVTNLQWSREAA